MRNAIVGILGSAAALTAIFGIGSMLAPEISEAKPKRDIRFQTSDRCMACHNSLVTPQGEDVSIGMSWRATMMANSARDPYWQAGVRRETIDHPESSAFIQDECAICHMPMMRYQAHYEDREAEVFTHTDFDEEDIDDKLAADGVSCSLCHQITPDKLGTRESLVGRFVIDTSTPFDKHAEYGPFDIKPGHQTIMRSSSSGYEPTKGEQIRKSELCATCHTLITSALGPDGKVIGSLPEQMPYQEWYHSAFRETESCQNCHLPKVEVPTPITRVLGEPREDMGRHIFIGGNFFITRILARYRAELSVAALPQELANQAERTINHLQTKTARISIGKLEVANGRLDADISIENVGGHKFPTAYPSRRAWLHIVVKDRNGNMVFESGKLEPNGRIIGNDNDDDPLKYEPHYDRITAADQVQIYEGIMVDREGKPTTGLLNALRYEKDNRLLPRGFDKKTADDEIAVHGPAFEDADFVGGGDEVHYSIPVGSAQGPFVMEAEFYFQPVGYRWAQNLKNYDAFEPSRFSRYYEQNSEGSAVVVAHASVAR